MIVEDDISSIFYLKEILKETGADLLIAEDGERAIRFCTENPEIDIVLMDIQLPILNGYETTRQIKTNSPHLPVIAQTAYALPEERNRCLAAGCDDYISKPINPFEILAMIQKFL